MKAESFPSIPESEQPQLVEPESFVGRFMQEAKRRLQVASATFSVDSGTVVSNRTVQILNAESERIKQLKQAELGTGNDWPVTPELPL